jgi:hypothetical protein
MLKKCQWESNIFDQKTYFIYDLNNSFNCCSDLRLTLSGGRPKSAANAQKKYREKKIS